MGYIIKQGTQTSNLYTKAGQPIPQQQRQGQMIKVPNYKVKWTDSLSRRQQLSVQAKQQKYGQNFTRTSPIFDDPRYSHTTLALPTDKATLHGLYRFYDENDPVVNNANRLHTEFPLSQIQLADCGDPGIQQHYEEMWYNRIQGTKTLADASLEYYRIGNVFLFGAWNESDCMWQKFAILNPDYVEVESTWLTEKPLIKLSPDESLRRLVQTQQPKYLYDQLHPEIIKYVRLGQQIPLDPNNTFHLAHNKAPYETLGKPLVKNILKILLYEHRIYEAQFAIATRHVMPLTVVKLGDRQSGWLPSQEELDEFAELLAAHEIDPNFSIIYHWGVEIEFYGPSGKVLPMNNELSRVDNLKMIGMQVSKSFLSGESGPYANAQVGLAVLRQRYLNWQLRLRELVEHGWFKPVADLAGFYTTNRQVSGAYYSGNSHGFVKAAKEDYLKRFSVTTLRDIKDNYEFRQLMYRKEAEWVKQAYKEDRKYIYPKLSFGMMNLSADQQWRNWIKQLNDYYDKKGIPFVSKKTLYNISNLDGEAEASNVEREMVEDKNKMLRYQQLGLIDTDPNKPGLQMGEGAEPGALTPLPGGGVELGGGEAEGGEGEGVELPEPGEESAVELLGEEVKSKVVEDVKLLKQSNEKLKEKLNK